MDVATGTVRWSTRSFARGATALALLLCACAAALAQGQPPPAGPARAPDEWLPSGVKNDLGGLIRQRTIHVAVPYSRTLYFNDNGRERGLTADSVRDFERWINRRYKDALDNRPITVVIRPTTRDKLLTEVAKGRADIAAGNLTITDQRRKLVDFAVAHGQKPANEVVLTGPKSVPIPDANALAGKTVHVRPSSSYHSSLTQLNERFRKEGQPAMKLVLVPDALEDEDMMEMLNAGLLQTIVVDDWKARMWTRVLPRIIVNEGAVVRSRGQVGWAVRKGSPKLKAALDEYHDTVLRKRGVYNQWMNSYNAKIQKLKDSTGSAERKRFEDTLALFEKYGSRYGFDPLMLAAQGYQESQLEQDAKSPVGAIGIMQLMPATAAELNVGDIRIAEVNVHAGTKYMDQLMTRYLDDAKFDRTNRTLFAFAAYNCGPGNIRKMRAEAEKRGLDKNRWFNNVELVTAEKIGMETTTYVRNIYKYYVAYTLMEDIAEVQRKAREGVQRGK